MTPPQKDKCPNFKVDEFFCWLRYIWKEVWILAKGFSVNKQTCKMQVKSKYKSRCGKFKRLGDGLQRDCIADDGYTWDFYFWNEPCDPELLAKEYCPMHCRLLHTSETQFLLIVTIPSQQFVQVVSRGTAIYSRDQK